MPAAADVCIGLHFSPRSIRLLPLLLLVYSPSIMPPDAPPSPRDRREYYRITVTLPMSLQPEADETADAFIEKAVNLSGGGIGVTVNALYEPNAVLALTLRLPDHGLFKSYIEVLRLEPIPYPADTYRLHARFVRMPQSDREFLVRQILKFQRDHLNRHYSA